MAKRINQLLEMKGSVFVLSYNGVGGRGNELECFKSEFESLPAREVTPIDPVQTLATRVKIFDHEFWALTATQIVL